MENAMWSLLATLGMVAIEASYVPQILRLHRLKAASEVSVLFPGLNLFGRLCAVSYALHLQDPVLAIGFGVGIVLRATFFVQVLLYREPDAEEGADVSVVDGRAPLLAEVSHG